MDRIRKRPFSFAAIVIGALFLAGWWVYAARNGLVWAVAVGTIAGVFTLPLIVRWARGTR
jgi:hypothetical protein